MITAAIRYSFGSVIIAGIYYMPMIQDISPMRPGITWRKKNRILTWFLWIALQE